jgi:DNA primase
LKSNGEGEIEHVIEKQYKVFHRIYLSLQEDEVELANPLFRDIFNDLINYYLQNEGFSLEQYLMHLQPEFAQEVTDILMEDERFCTIGKGRTFFLNIKGHYRSKCFRDYFNFTLVSSR